MAAILETRSLACRFGGVVAVDNVNLSIKEGELRCLIGPNGAGKSTLFKCLTHQHQPTSGRILLQGNDVTNLSPHMIARRGVAIKNQVPTVYGGLSVHENLWLAARRKYRPKQLDAVLTDTLIEIGFRPPQHLNARVDQLSHAHRQWVELGMLLVSKPVLALLDEPTAGMTHDEMLKTVEIIRRLNRQSTVIVVEHDLEFISLLANQVTVLHRGAILVEGSMAEITQNEMVQEIYLGKKRDAA
ncbi:hypothetical protein Lal_00042025 [Lupinus albus]|jgi:branched-chain amino acid transport system ATP-binding protein|nr:hypothetical protein Lal_00042025 [Lupinus albus]